MARPLRVDVKDGWYHVSARGIERRDIFRDPRDYGHFLELLGEMAERHMVIVHAYALMTNHYHLLIQTPESNASKAIQWLNVSYSVWFNLRHKRAGHVFQGRFNSVLVDGDGAWVLLESVYVHLNPIRVGRLGLDKQSRKAEGRGLKDADSGQIQERLKALKSYAWSSYRAYAGYGSGPGWLMADEIMRRGGGSTEYRRFVESYVRQGKEEELIDQLKARVVIGAREFVEKAKRLIKKVGKEQPDRRILEERVDFGQIVRAVEDVSGRKWEEFVECYGDSWRDTVLYIARRRSGLTLAEIGDKAGGLDYKTVGKAIGRFAAKLGHDKGMTNLLAKCESRLSIVET